MDRIHRHKADGGIPGLGENLCYPTLDKTINRGFRRFQGFFTAFDPISGFFRTEGAPILSLMPGFPSKRNAISLYQKLTVNRAGWLRLHSALSRIEPSGRVTRLDFGSHWLARLRKQFFHVRPEIGSWKSLDSIHLHSFHPVLC